MTTNDVVRQAQLPMHIIVLAPHAMVLRAEIALTARRCHTCSSERVAAYLDHVVLCSRYVRTRECSKQQTMRNGARRAYLQTNSKLAETARDTSDWNKLNWSTSNWSKALATLKHGAREKNRSPALIACRLAAPGLTVAWLLLGCWASVALYVRPTYNNTSIYHF